MKKKTLLWIGDSCVPSGFARATHGVLDTLRHYYNVVVLGINYRGDPHGHFEDDKWISECACGGAYPVYSAMVTAIMDGGDMNGVSRLVWMCDKVRPDVIVIQNDGWNIPAYVQRLHMIPDYAKIPIIAVVAIDGKNFSGKWLDGIELAIFWTHFAEKEARAGGFKGQSMVIPLGVDLNTFYPIDRDLARAELGLRDMLPDNPFIIGCVNRNQSRKRWDLLIKYFAKWAKEYRIQDAYLFLHVAPTGDNGVHVEQLMSYYDVWPQLIMREPPVWRGVDDHVMCLTYNSFDIAATTTQGEGFGLTTLEAMACGIPVVAPEWSALGDWARDAVKLVTCPTDIVGPPFVNVFGGVADERQFIEALQLLYENREERQRYSDASQSLAQQDRYRWHYVGQEYVKAVDRVLHKCELCGQYGAHVFESNEDGPIPSHRMVLVGEPEVVTNA